MFIKYFGSNNICIVTNAKIKWFNDSCLLYNKLLVIRFDINIISANDKYLRNKLYAFYNILSKKNKLNINEIICIGDSFDINETN